MRYLLHAVFCISAILFSFRGSIAQPSGATAGFEKQKQDALAELKRYPARDTFRVNALIRVFNTATFKKEREQLLPYQQEALSISREIDYRYGMAMSYASRGSYYKSASDYTNALRLYDSALYAIAESKEPRMLETRGSVYFRKGMIYFAQENYYPALNNFFSALNFTSDSLRALTIRVFVTDSYILLNNPDKAMEYARQSVRYLDHHTVPGSDHVSVYNSVVNIYLNKNQPDSAAYYVEKLRPYANDPKQVQIRFGYYMKKGHIAFKKERYNESLGLYKLAHQSAKDGGHANSISTALYFLSVAALKLGNNELARNYTLQNLSLVDSTNAKAGKVAALLNLGRYYHAVGNEKRAYEAIERSVNLKDSLLEETNIRQVNLLGAIYERELQQKEIERLQSEKELQAADVRQKSTLNKLFLISIIALLILGYLGYMNFRKGQQLAFNKEALQKQKIVDLEKDRQLLSIDAMLKGQEEERNRIAKDLHDGLGGLLSGTKLSFLNVKDRLPLSQEDRIRFDKSLSMLDNTITDLRKIAQNLLPEALVKYGLHDALSDYCDSIQSTTGIRTFYHLYGEQRPLDNTATVFIFRIIQELVNNAVKHAGATQIIVQLTFDHDKVNITVEDDGTGFDKALMKKQGAGISNVDYRVRYFNGTMDLDTSPGNGVSVNIQLNV